MPPRTRSSAQPAAHSPTKRISKKLAENIMPTSKISRAAKSKTLKPPPQKRARHTDPHPEPAAPPTKRVRGKQGKLKGLMNMPIDIFAEIATYLEPADLVHLARANKFFRQILMSRSFIHVWRSAEGNIEGLPPCPKDLCEPQYAALLFTKLCSLCGNQALRPMDPILQVRLCVECRDEHAVDTYKVTDSSLVFKSRTLVPTQLRRQQAWCLFNQARAIKIKLNEFQKNSPEEHDRWVKERRDVVRKRTQDAQPLVRFLDKIQKEHDVKLSAIRAQREAEVKSRLIKLGYEADLNGYYNKHWNKAWKSATHVAKPLTEHAWEEILPALLKHLKHNQARRLDQEKSQRIWNRQRRLSDWIVSMIIELGPFAQAMDISQSSLQQSNASSSEPSLTKVNQLVRATSTGNKLPISRMLQMPIPPPNQMAEWPALSILPTLDVSLEEFNQKLDRSKPVFIKAISERMERIEHMLIDLLPEILTVNEGGQPLDTSPYTSPRIANPIPEYTLVLGGSESRPFTSLSLGVQRLVRADCIFQDHSSSAAFYPDDFRGADTDGYTYNPQAVKIAGALLSMLGLPDVTYLQMKAAGKIFACGRCDTGQCKSWKEMIQHYLDEEAVYDTVQGNPRIRQAEVAYAFTHNVQVNNSDRPLVYVTNADDRKRFLGPDYRGRYRTCLVCESVGVSWNGRGNMVLNHLRNVHLIKTPEESKDYEQFFTSNSLIVG